MVVRFRTGAPVVRRDVVDGRVWSAQAARVLADDGDDLVIGYWPGAEALAPRQWLAWLASRSDADRAACLESFVERRWALAHRRWDTTNVVHHMAAGRWYSINAFYDGPTGELTQWYVNFERPHVRTARSIDTLDLLLDMVVQPDRSWQWKDEDELAHARALGAVTEADAAAVDRAREEVVALVESGRPLVPGAPALWRPSADWPTPELPSSVGTRVVDDRVPAVAAASRTSPSG